MFPGFLRLGVSVLLGANHEVSSIFAFVSALRPHIALLLLLCLTRTLLPEAWVLAMHQHEHTTDEPAQAAAFRHKGKALVSTRHQHCPVDNLYQMPFLVSAPVVAPTPVTRPCFASAPVPTVATAPWIARQPAQPRGPPARA